MKKILIVLAMLLTFGSCFAEGWVDIKKEWDITISYCEDYKIVITQKAKYVRHTKRFQRVLMSIHFLRQLNMNLHLNLQALR